MSLDDDLPEPDRIEGAPHPRETTRLLGQTKAEADFLEAYNSGRLHSGWMITGPRGIGKATLAYKIAAFLLSEPPQDGAGLFGDAPLEPTSLDVGEMSPELPLIRAGSHPRLAVVRRDYNEKTKKLRTEITADPVRDLKKFFHMSAADGGRRVVIVDVADEMNPTAANSILKELEEPPERTTILLLAHQPSRLLPTIKSRCRELRCATLSTSDMTEALTQAGFHSDETEALNTLAAGSVGEAIRLLQHDGLQVYAEMIQLFEGIPNVNRAAAMKLAESCAGKGAETRFPMVLDLFDILLSRLARTGLLGEPDTQGAAHEARLLIRLSPHDVAARQWAALQQDLSQRVRHGRAVNLDPAALILDMVFKIEKAANGIAN